MLSLTRSSRQTRNTKLKNLEAQRGTLESRLRNLEPKLDPDPKLAGSSSTCDNIRICIYIYIQKQREREKKKHTKLLLHFSQFVPVAI